MNISFDKKILVTGGNGLLGTHLCLKLKQLGFSQVFSLTHRDCDLMDWKLTQKLFENYQPDYVFHTAAAVFGIMGNIKNKGLSFFQNTLINTHVLEAARQAKVKKIVAMGSGAAYPYPAPDEPLREEMIWYGIPHVTEDSYGHSKRAMLAQLIAYKESDGLDYAYAISTNLYGSYDKFDIELGHVIPSLIRKFYEAKRDGKKVIIWGDGSARRDLLHAEDAAQALYLMMENLSGAVNIASGRNVLIREVVAILAEHTGMQNHIEWDLSKPNGQHSRTYELSRLASLNFKPNYTLENGLKMTYDWYASHSEQARK